MNNHNHRKNKLYSFKKALKDSMHHHLVFQQFGFFPNKSWDYESLLVQTLILLSGFASK
jgi:hypothetical protein